MKPLNQLLTAWAAVVIALIIFAVCMSSCTTVHKVFHKQKEKVDSTAHVITSTDSSGKKNTSNLSKSDVGTISKSDSSHSSDYSVIEETKKIIEFDTAGRKKKVTYLQKKTSNNKTIATGSTFDFLEGGNLDSSTTSEEGQKLSHQDATTQLHKNVTDKAEDKTTHSMSWPLWLLLIAAIIFYLYKKRQSMKKFFLGLIVLLSFNRSFAQEPVDSSAIPQTIALSQDQHIYLIGFMGEIRSAEKIKYVNQVAAQYDSTDTAKVITVVAPSSLIVRMYQTMTVLPEGVGYIYNNAIKDALMPQITNAWLGARIMDIIADNNRYLNNTKDAARKLIESLQ
jgi:hypothetical protein